MNENLKKTIKILRTQNLFTFFNIEKPRIFSTFLYESVLNTAEMFHMLLTHFNIKI